MFDRGCNGVKIVDEYRANGIYITSANVGRVDGAANLLKLLGDMNPKPPYFGGIAGPTPAPILPSLYIFERCAQLIACLPSLVHSIKNPDDVLKVDMDENGRGGDDAYDAFRYGLMAAFQRSEKPVFDPTTMYRPVNRERPEPLTPVWWRE